MRADGVCPPRDLLANNAFTTTIGAGRHKQQTSQAVVGPFVGPGDLGGPGGTWEIRGLLRLPPHLSLTLRRPQDWGGQFVPPLCNNDL